MDGTVFRAKFKLNEHEYEVILDVGGQWDGMVHILDAELPHDAERCTDVVMTGARWDGKTVTIGSADVHCDVLLAFELATKAADVLRGRTHSWPPSTA